MVRIDFIAAVCLLAGSAAAASSACASKSRSQASSSLSRSRSSATGTLPGSSASASRSRVSSSASRPRSTGTGTSLGSSASASRSQVSSSASRPTVSGTSATGTSATATCPEIEVLTYTVPTYATVYTGSTITTTVSSSTFTTVTVTLLHTSFVAVASSTGYYTVDSVATSVTALPASTTVTIPTAAGFTPAACLPASQRATTLTKIIGTTTASDSTSYVYYPEILTYSVTQYVRSGTTTSTTSLTSLLLPIIRTVTSTRDPGPTSTVYAACATNNVVAANPDDGYYDLVTPASDFNSSDSRLASQFVQSYAVDAADCCALCQADAKCAGSAWTSLLFNPDELPRCDLFIKPADKNTCDPRYVGAWVSGKSDVATTFISNSACGSFKILDGN